MQQQFLREHQPVPLAYWISVQIHLLKEAPVLSGAQKVLRCGVQEAVGLHHACFVKVTWRANLQRKDQRKYSFDEQ